MRICFTMCLYTFWPFFILDCDEFSCQNKSLLSQTIQMCDLFIYYKVILTSIIYYVFV